MGARGNSTKNVVFLYTFQGQFLPGVGRAMACGDKCGNGGEGSCGGVGGDSAV